MLYQKEKELSTQVEAFLDGEKAAFDRLGRLVMEDIVNIAYRYVGNREDAKDITQEVLIKLYRGLSGFHHSSKIATWIYRVTVNASLDYLRRQKP